MTIAMWLCSAAEPSCNSKGVQRSLPVLAEGAVTGYMMVVEHHTVLFEDYPVFVVLHFDLMDGSEVVIAALIDPEALITQEAVIDHMPRPTPTTSACKGHPQVATPRGWLPPESAVSAWRGSTLGHRLVRR